MTERIFTSESVTEGHPDKVCDQISDAVLDSIIGQDKTAHVACETVCTTGMVMVLGEISTSCYVDIPTIARDTIKRIGYNRPEYGFDGTSCAVITSIDEQSPDIAQGVNHAFDNNSDIGAGDQGMMFGYACDETKELMPAPISYAHRLSRQLAEIRKNNTLNFLRPDGKTQVTVHYGERDEIVDFPAIVVSTQHSPDVSIETLREAVVETVIKPVIPEKYITKDTKIFVNPTGRFVVGGPVGDTGLTGRKIIVDTYGGVGGHGGGAFSGKDPTKVDRSGAYMARYIAKNIVAAGLAKKCEIWIAYAIGVAEPVSVMTDTKGTGVMEDARLSKLVREKFDMRPAKIISKLGLLEPIYSKTASYGHFGRTDIDLPWEHIDMADMLRNYK